MIFPVKRVKEELINEFAVSKMTIDEFSKIRSCSGFGSVIVPVVTGDLVFSFKYIQLIRIQSYIRIYLINDKKHGYHHRIDELEKEIKVVAGK